MMNKSVHLLVELNGSEELVWCGVEEGRRKGGFHEPYRGCAGGRSRVSFRCLSVSRRKARKAGVKDEKKYFLKKRQI
jgi:hypothetical protein